MNFQRAVLIILGLMWLSTSTPFASAEPAGVSPLDMKSLRFFGRWDLRTPEHALTVNSGSYVKARFEGSDITAKFDLATNKPPLPTIAWQIDNGEWQESAIADQVKLGEGLPGGPHTLILMARGLDEHQPRWTPPLVASISFEGFELPVGGKLLGPLPEWDHPKRRMEIIGDSITEGVLVHSKRDGKQTWPWQTDGRLAYSGQTAVRLGAEWRQVGFGAQGITHGGSGGTASAPDTFNFFYKGCPRDDWQPDLVVINHGTNDGGAPSSHFRPLYAKYLEQIRSAYPKAKIAAMRPFNGAHAADILAEVKARNESGDADVFFIDSTGWLGKTDFTDGLHPNVEGSEKAADKLAPELEKLLPARGN